jgi:membrane protease YdiL (CAAX protease family)
MPMRMPPEPSPLPAPPSPPIEPLPEMLLAIPFGLIFAVLALRSRSLLWPILLHLIIGLSNDLFSLAAAKRELGYQPPLSWQQGLQQSVFGG